VDSRRRVLQVNRVVPRLLEACASDFDPQPFHLDVEAARDSILGGLAASG